MSIWKHAVVLALFWALIYVVSCRYPPGLLDDADSVHAEAAREMVETGDWVTLHANGIRYLEKAPLMYWSIAVSYKLFGVSEFSSRFPIALATLGLMLATLLLGRFAFGQRAGLYSALAIGTCAGIFLFTRVLWPDVLLTLWITLAFYCFLRALEDPKDSKFAYGIYFFGALGVLTKGLIGAAFPGLIILAYLIITKRIRELGRLKVFSGSLLFAVVAVPWHIAAGLNNPGSLMIGTPSPNQGRGFFWFYFMNEHLLRYVGKRYPADYDTVPLPLFLALHLVWLFPWSFFIPLAIREIPRRVRNTQLADRATIFCALWAFLIILFFCFSTTQEYYTMPCYPAFALLISYGLAKAEERIERQKVLKVTQLALVCFGLVIFAAGIATIWIARSVTSGADISSTLTRNPGAYALSLGHVLDLTPASFARLRVPVIGTSLTFLIGTATAFLLRKSKKDIAANISMALMMAAFFLFAQSSFGVFGPYLSSRDLAAAIDAEYEPGDSIVINGEYEGGSSINFYTRKPVFILNGRSANLEYGSYFKDAPQIFIDDEQLAKMWEMPGRVFLFTDSEKVPELGRAVRGQSYTLAERGGKLILTNQQSD